MLDFSSIAPADISADDIKGTSTRRSAVLDTPVYGWFQETIASGSGKSVALATADEAKELVRLVGLAASELNVGRKVRTNKRADGTYTVMFVAAPKRRRRSKEEIEAEELEAAMNAHPAGKGRK